MTKRPQELIPLQTLGEPQRTSFPVDATRTEIITSEHDGQQYVVTIQPQNRLQQPVIQQVNHFHGDYHWHEPRPAYTPRPHRRSIYAMSWANKLLMFVILIAFMAFLAAIK